MANTVKTTAKKNTAVDSKLCIRCNQVLPLGVFFPNKKWISQQYHDVWCKECAAKYCKDKAGVQQYFHDNNRVWKDTLWDAAGKRARYELSKDAEYLSPKTSQEKRQKIETEQTAQCAIAMMNLANYYTFIDNHESDLKAVGEMPDGEQNSTLEYNKKWNGFFTPEQIEALEAKYSSYEDDFVLDNANIRDYALKTVKASLNADIAEDRLRRGQITVSEYRDTLGVFDTLSKSSNFAACRRKPGEATGMGSLGEIILKMEIEGVLGGENPYHFPDDDVDAVTNDFRHTITAIGAQLK